MTVRRNRGKGLTTVLVLACAALSYLVYWEFNNYGPEPYADIVVTSSDQSARKMSPEPEFALPPLVSYAAIVERPLFAASRRPSPPAPEEPEEPEPDQAEAHAWSFILSGVVISNDQRMALLQRLSDGSTVRLRVGQEIDGWRIEAIEPDRVVLRQGDALEEVKLPNKIERAAVKGRLRTRNVEPNDQDEAETR